MVLYGIFTYIYHKNQLNVGKYTIHGWYGKWMVGLDMKFPEFGGQAVRPIFRDVYSLVFALGGLFCVGVFERCNPLEL